MVANIRSHRFVALVALAAVLLAGVLSGLTILPHTHHGDPHHGTHPSCAVYQYSLSHMDLAISAVLFVIAIRSFCFVAPKRSIVMFGAQLPQRNLRGPPFSS